MTSYSINEKTFTAHVRQLAKLLGYDLVYHTFNSMRSPKGFPDLVMVHPGKGRIIFAELKSEKGKTTPHQDAWLEGLRACGLEAYVWRPSEFETIAEVLRG